MATLLKFLFIKLETKKKCGANYKCKPRTKQVLKFPRKNLIRLYQVVATSPPPQSRGLLDCSNEYKVPAGKVLRDVQGKVRKAMHDLCQNLFLAVVLGIHTLCFKKAGVTQRSCVQFFTLTIPENISIDRKSCSPKLILQPSCFRWEPS